MEDLDSFGRVTRHGPTLVATAFDNADLLESHANVS